ncbi:hypothetical protein ACJ41O_010252 [Fusarium nematophilum]
MAKQELMFGSEIRQMMYVGGETQNPSAETLALVEDILKGQVTLLLTTANEIASRRGSRIISNNDLIFQVRHDPVRVDQLVKLVRWRKVRRRARGSDEGAPELAEVEDLDDGDDAMEIPADASGANKVPLPEVVLPWDVRFFYSQQPPDEDPEEEAGDFSEAHLQKLRRADEKTKNMSAEEYAKWSEYRLASFTSRKAQRFRDWSGLGVIARNKKSDETLDILGYLLCGMVDKLTDIALEVQKRELILQQGHDGELVKAVEASRQGLFAAKDVERPPIDVRHVREAFQITQRAAGRKRPKLHRVPGNETLKLI